MGERVSKKGMQSLTRDFRVAFGGAWRSIGAVIAGVAVFNFLAGLYQFGLAPFLHQVLSSFRTVTHPIATLLVGWLPFEVPAIAKDGIVLWLIAAGVVWRTVLPLKYIHAEKPKLSVIARLVVLCILAWPWVIAKRLKTPLVFTQEGTEPGFEHVICNWRGFRNNRDGLNNPKLKINFVNVFWLQLTAVVSVVVVLAIYNVIGL